MRVKPGIYRMSDYLTDDVIAEVRSRRRPDLAVRWSG